MLLRAFLTFNVIIGTAFGGFGIAVPALRERFDVGLSTVTLGLSLVVLAVNILMPVGAASVARLGLRRAMTVGVLLGAAGNITLALAPNIAVALIAFGLLIGPAGAMAGTIPTSLLAGGWYPHARGRAVGMTMMPVGMTLAPVVGYVVIERLGLSAFYLGLAGLHLLLLIALIGVREPPIIEDDDVVDLPIGGVPKSGIPTGQLLMRPVFWCLVLGSGSLYAIGLIDATHTVSVLIERGISRGEAAILVSVMGGAGVVGSLGIGYLADRIGGTGALAVVAMGFAGAWSVIGLTSWLPAMVPAMIVAGTCSAGIFSALNVATAHFFGAATLGRATGFLAMCTLPLTFLLSPGAGLLHDITGSYTPVIAAIVGLTGAVAILFAMLSRRERYRPNQ